MSSLEKDPVEAEEVDDFDADAAVDDTSEVKSEATGEVGGAMDKTDEGTLDDDEEDEEVLDESTVDAEEAEEVPEEDDVTVRSEDASSHKSPSTPHTGSRSSPRPSAGSSAKRGRTPSVRGLTIPFRTVKKAMKLDPDTPIVQNEAAIMTTIAAELFVKRLANESFRHAKNRGRNTIRYEDIAEARTNNPALTFLETLLP